MVDSHLAFDIMARDDGATAVLAKVERALDRTGNAAKKNSAISEAAAKASANLTKAHNAETDALDKVQVAEARLADVRGNSKAKTGQIVAAEKALAKARRDAAVAGNVAQKATKELSQALDNEGKKAGKGFSSNLKKWLSGSSGMADAGKTGGTVFGSGFLGVIKTPVLGPAVVAAISAAVVTALPAVGAVAASGLVAGFGAGLAGLGIVFAAKSVAVKNAWNRAIWSMGKDMTLLSKPFEATLVSIAGFAQRTFAKFAPSLEANFKEIAPAVTKFADDLGRGFERLQPAIRPLSEAFTAVLGSLGPAMQSALGSVSDGLVTLSESVKKNPDGLSDLVEGLGSLTNKALGAITALNNINGAFQRLTGGTSAVDLIFGKANSTIGKFIFMVKDSLDPLSGVKNGFDALIGSAGKASTAVGLTGSAAQMFTQGLNSSQVAAVLAGKSVDQLGGSVARSAHETHAANVAAFLLATAYDRQASATQNANDALTRYSNLLLSLSGSEIAYQQAVDDVTAAIKENGRTHDINTQKGRDNQTALNQSAVSANAQIANLRNTNQASVAVARAAQTEYAKQAVQMGYTATEAHRMAQEFIKIPPKVKADFKVDITDMTAKVATAKKQLADPHLSATKKAKLEANIVQWQAGIAAAKRALAGLPADKTAKLLANKADLDAKLAAAKKELANPALTATKRAKLEATYANLLAAVRAAQAKINSLQGKTVVNHVVTAYTTTGSRSSGSGSGGGHINETRASGGPVVKGHPYWVGEKGPEPFIPDQNGTILPNSAVRKGGSSKVMGLSVAAGLAGGIQSGASSAISAAGDMANAVIAKANQVLGISSPSKKFTQIALYIAQGFNKGIRGSTASIQSAMASLMSKVVGLGFSSAKQGRILRMLQMENKGLQAMVIKRAAVANQLKAAQASLADAIQIREDFRKSITDAALAFNSITNIQPEGGGILSGHDIIDKMQETLARTKNFAADLATLKAQGLRGDLYKQIADAGVEAGGATAAALLQGGKGAVAQANDLQRQIANASAGLGNTAAKNMYQAGVDAAQGLVNGLLAKTKALDLASQKLANAIVAQIKKTLGIRSPSKVLEWHGSMAGQGFRRGIEGEYGRVAKAGAGLGNAATNIRSMPGGGGTSGQLPLKVELVFKSDGSPEMDRLVREVRKFVKVNGGNVQQALGSK